MSSMGPPCWSKLETRNSVGVRKPPLYVVEEGGFPHPPPDKPPDICLMITVVMQYDGQDEPTRYTYTRTCESRYQRDHGCMRGHAGICTPVRACMYVGTRTHGHEWALMGSQRGSRSRTHGLMRACGHTRTVLRARARAGGHTRAGLLQHHSVHRTTHRLETLSNILL